MLVRLVLLLHGCGLDTVGLLARSYSASSRCETSVQREERHGGSGNPFCLLLLAPHIRQDGAMLHVPLTHDCDSQLVIARDCVYSRHAAACL